MRSKKSRILVIGVVIALVAPRSVPCAEKQECEEALAALDRAGASFTYKDNRSYLERKKAGDGSTCEDLSEILLDSADADPLKLLSHLRKVRDRGSIDLRIRRFDATQSEELAKHAALLTKMQKVRLGFAEGISDPDLRHLSKISNLANLFSVSLKPSNVTDAGLMACRELHQMEYLTLNNTQITDAGLVHLKGMTKLKLLALTQTAISGEGLRHVKDLPIERLVLVETKVDDEGLKHFQGFKHLSQLSLTDCPIKGPGLKHLSQLENLQRLALTRTHIDDSHLPIFQTLPMLQDLTLYECNITDAGVESLAQLKGLKRLAINDTKITEAGAEKLRQALPDTKIGH